MPKFVDKEAKRLEIISAAMKVFAQSGVVNAKMSEIAEVAGVGKGTIYEYFRSKEEIFSHAFELFFQEMRTALREIANSSDSPEARLRKFIKTALVDFTTGNEEFLNIMLDFWAEGIRSKNENVSQILDLDAIYSEFRAVIASILDEGIREGSFRPVDSNIAASTLIGVLDGLYLQWAINPFVFKFEEVGDFLVDNFLRGIKNN
ncbi:transcriptional regulator, TetR family [Chloroherpeton thalassium ATCC 35110]|uniref:Transcriptional regulator, TetR family n=1 Tax=Chloroherpeton thalassium (strain ATCC 35110 / GB-78) TaxID=517418 RepID=B3QSY4_CHLT3|nr:TetR/AcrR family transcriptional regulator [Chloroherpeton thalassium]ACF12627.1 transcriptional regulator, TetR family [Chloroherpeton thalassium ATCC 35110]